MFKHIETDLGYADLESVTLPSHRKYLTPNGTEYPSITTVLSLLSEKSIMAWRKRVGDEEADKISRIASQRGTAVHDIIERYLNNDPAYTKGYSPHIVSSLYDLKEILDTNIGDIYALECPLYSDHLGVAGRVDCVAMYNGRLSIIDFKTSKRPKTEKYIKNYFMQEAAYAIMWEERMGIPITQLVTLIAVDYNEPQVFIEHRDNWTGELHEAIKNYKSTH
jgi:hypothetical protein